MDLSTSSSPAPPARCPPPRRGLPALLAARAAATGCCSTAARAPSSSCCARSGCPSSTRSSSRTSTLDHWLGLPGMLKTFDLRARERPLDDLRPARPAARCSTALRPVIGRTGYPLDAGRARAARRGPLRRLPDRRRSRSSTASRRSATRSWRTSGPGASTPSGRARSGVDPGPDFGRLQRGETVERRAPGAGDGRAAARAADRDLRRHRAVPDGRGARPRGRPARPRGDLPRGRARPRARDRPLDRRARRPSSPATPSVRLLALTHLSTRYFPREVRDEARAVFERHGRPARLRRDRGPVPRARRAPPGRARPEPEPAPLP